MEKYVNGEWPEGYCKAAVLGCRRE